MDLALITAFIFALICFFFYLLGSINKQGNDSLQYIQRFDKDEFDSSLTRLNSFNKLITYCDSFYEANLPNRTYPGIVSETIRKRFYHGYSYYNMGNNAAGVILEPIVGGGATAIVIPDDIIKYPHAACSQQSILGMEVFKRKGYLVRKVAMFDTVIKVGHFAYEVYYENGWHYYDTDQEPDARVLERYNRPSTAFLVANPDIILEAYRMRKDPQLFKRLLMNYKLGPVNKFPAPNAYFYQVVTKYFTYFGWIFFLVIILVRYSLQRVKIRQSASAPSSAGKKENQVPAFS